jgi:hypothetical protein
MINTLLMVKQTLRHSFGNTLKQQRCLVKPNPFHQTAKIGDFLIYRAGWRDFFLGDCT